MSRLFDHYQSVNSRSLFPLWRDCRRTQWVFYDVPWQFLISIFVSSVYVDTARSSTATRLVFNTDGTAGSWRIKVMQLQCYDIAKYVSKCWNSFISLALNCRPPNGCMQYFTGASGEFKSFSFGDGDTSMIRNSFYTICIRREQGFCQIDYAIQDVQGTTPAYQLSNDATAQNVIFHRKFIKSNLIIFFLGR